MACIGKSKQQKCFRNADDDEFNQRYTSNKTAWFNRGVTQYWFQDVFVPWFNESFRVDADEESYCIMIMNGCSDHNVIQEWLDGNGLYHIRVITLPPNVTSRNQPMDQGIIAWTKNKYKYDLIRDLLEIYCDEKKRQLPVSVARVTMESDGVCVQMYMMISKGCIGFGMRLLKKAL